MNDLVFIQDNERAITTSQKIAERFGKKMSVTCLPCSLTK